MNKIKKSYIYIYISILIIAIIGRLWLIAGSNWHVNIETYFDSHLELNSAINILSGKWMGPYSKFTLCKNPSFPIFLALSYFLHIPYAYALGLFIILTSFLFVKAIKPLINNKTLELIVFLLILYNPTGFTAISYHYRNAITPWAILLCISAILGIFIRKDSNIKQILPYSILGFFSLGFFWMLREDSIWFLPFVLGAFILTIGYWIIKKIKFKQLIAKLLLASFPILGIIFSILTVSTLNYVKYGIFIPNDRTSGEGAKALGLLIQIDDGSDLNNDYWVSNEALNLAKKVSPTFNSLNFQTFDNWPKIGDYSIWAFRDAMTDSGYFTNAKETQLIYKKIKEELQSAFKDGRLKRKNAIQLSSTSGIYSKEEIFKTTSILLPSLFTHVDYRYAKVTLESVANQKNEGDLIKYEKLLGIDILRNENELNNIGADVELRKLNQINLKYLYINKSLSNIIITFYQITGWIFFTLSIISFIHIIFKLIRHDKIISFKWEIFLMMLGLILSVFSNSYMVGLWGIGFNLDAHNELFAAYTDSQYILIQLFEIIGLVYIINIIKDKVSKHNVTYKEEKK